MSMEENHQNLLAMASDYQHSAMEQVVRILSNQEYSTIRGESLSDALKKHRGLALERARMEADFEVKLSALKKIKATLAKTPDLDIDKQFEIEVRKLDEEEGPTDRDLENTDPVIREIDQKLSSTSL